MLVLGMGGQRRGEMVCWYDIRVWEGGGDGKMVGMTMMRRKGEEGCWNGIGDRY